MKKTIIRLTVCILCVSLIFAAGAACISAPRDGDGQNALTTPERTPIGNTQFYARAFGLSRVNTTARVSHIANRAQLINFHNSLSVGWYYGGFFVDQTLLRYYDRMFFIDNYLVILAFIYFGGERFVLRDVLPNGDILIAYRVAASGTGGGAASQWHIVIELPRSFNPDSFNVITVREYI